jgi:hypothetical protein
VGLTGLFLQRALFAAPVTLLWTVAALREQMPEAGDPGPGDNPEWAQQQRHRADADLDCARADDDDSRSCAVGMVRKMNVLATLMQSFAMA